MIALILLLEERKFIPHIPSSIVTGKGNYCAATMILNLQSSICEGSGKFISLIPLCFNF